MLSQSLWAAPTASAPSQTVILHPARGPELRIDFNYNFQNALPPFEKEPALPGNEVFRGRIPTVPPTFWLRNTAKSELYLNTDHAQDFVTGKLATYRSFYNGHVVFTNLTVTSLRDGLEIPYTLDLYTYEQGAAGWLHVRSGWAGEFAVAGQKWQLTVVDNLDGQIGRGRHPPSPPPGFRKDKPADRHHPVPEALFLDGTPSTSGSPSSPATKALSSKRPSPKPICRSGR